MFDPAFAPHRMQIESLKSGFFCAEITHIRAVYRPARKAVQYSHFVVDGPKFALAGSCIVHITGQGGFAMLLERFDHVAQVAISKDVILSPRPPW